MALAAALVWQALSGSVRQLEVEAHWRAARTPRYPVAATRRRDRSDRRQFGHSPTGLDLGLKHLLQPPKQGIGATRSAYQDPFERRQMLAGFLQMVGKSEPY